MKILLAAALAALGLRAAAAAPADDPRLTIDLDPRLELLWAVRQLADPAASAPPSLEPLRKHPAVALDAAFDKYRFDTRTRYESLVRRDLKAWEQPGPDDMVSTRFTQPAGSEDAWRKWSAALDAFSREKAFQKRLAERREELAPFLAAARQDAREVGLLAAIERYTGLPFKAAHLVVPSPFPSEEGGSVFGLVVRKTDGTYQLVNAVDPKRFTVRQNADSLWHEEAHALMDTLADLFRDQVETSEGLFQERPDCRGEWLQCVKEHVNDAVAARVVARELGDDAASRSEEWMGKRHPFLPGLLKRLKAFEAARAKDPKLTLAAFYGDLLGAFPAAPAPPKDRNTGAGLPNLFETLSFPYWTDGERAHALETLERALPGATGSRRRAQAAAFAEMLGRRELALDYAAKALERRPDDVLALVVRGDASRALGRHREADEALASARKICAKSREQQACRMFWPATAFGGPPPGPSNPLNNAPAAPR